MRSTIILACLLAIGILAGCKGKTKNLTEDEKNLQKLDELNAVFESVWNISPSRKDEFKKKSEDILALCKELQAVENIDKVCGRVERFVENKSKYLERAGECQHLIDRMAADSQKGAGGEIDMGDGFRLNKSAWKGMGQLIKCEETQGIYYQGRNATEAINDYKLFFPMVRKKLAAKSFVESPELRQATAEYAKFFPEVAKIFKEKKDHHDAVFMELGSLLGSQDFQRARKKVGDAFKLNDGEYAEYKKMFDAIKEFQDYHAPKTAGESMSGKSMKILGIIQMLEPLDGGL